jgi:SAM-dependent methyltransferase
VDHVLEHAEDMAEPETQEKLQVPLHPSTSSYAIEAFRKRYGDKTFSTPPKVADSTARKQETETPKVVNDFADIDSLLNTVERQDDQHASSSSQAGLVVASGTPISCDFLKVKLKQEMDLHASGYGTIAELDGADAVAIVEEACPDIGRFEVSKVLRFGDSIPADENDTLLAYFGRKYAPSPWRLIACSGGWINFIFGRELPMGPMCGNERKAVRAAPAIVTDFLMPRWLREQIDKAAEGLPSLSATEVQLTSQLSSDDVRRYAQTYLPRSCAEAFVTLDWVLGEELIDSEMSVLDLGCGSGGASLGCLLAIHKHAASKCSVQIDGVDANIHSLAFAEDLIKKSKKVFLDDRVRFNPHEVDFSNGIGTDRKYDIVIASKSIGELALRNGENAYAETVRLCAEKLAEDGIMLVVEIPKHEASLREALNRLKGIGIDGWCQCMHITVDGGKDNEDFVCACATRKANAETKEK